ncbi:MAG: aminodeoxychorismate/anthranilate synthase component II [Alphaproteobacteria bacterium]|nr:aminodeoxychorismate/anthranilate synthase component II [Alphaproteobacteria bacterium]
MLLLIDNYDSFTYNLVHFIGELGAACEVHRNDKLSADEAIAKAPKAIVLSPGPCTPNEAGICLELIEKAAGRFPILGVCLGHQAIGQAYGGTIVRTTPMHGKLSPVTHDGTGIFCDLPNPINVTRYHSLTIEPATLPDCLQVSATTSDGTIMGVAHKEHPVHGVQFHPESIASEMGHEMLANFLSLAGFKTNRPAKGRRSKAAA